MRKRLANRGVRFAAQASGGSILSLLRLSAQVTAHNMPAHRNNKTRPATTMNHGKVIVTIRTNTSKIALMTLSPALPVRADAGTSQEQKRLNGSTVTRLVLRMLQRELRDGESVCFLTQGPPTPLYYVVLAHPHGGFQQQNLSTYK